MVKVQSLMTSEPAWAPADATLDEAILMMDEQRVRHLPVVEGRTLVGVVSGVFLGWVVVGSVADSVDLSLNWGRVGLIVLAGVVISVLASLWPAVHAARLEPVEAMRK